MRQPCVYEMKEKIGGLDNTQQINIHTYASRLEYDEFSIKSENLRTLRGCFIKDGYLGQIKLTSFNINIKSLVSNFSFNHNLTLSEWHHICGFMKKKVCDNMDEPDQLVALIAQIFETKAIKDCQDDFNIKHLQLDRFKKHFDTVEVNLRKKILSKDLQNDVLAIQTLKRKIRAINGEFMKHQNRSKLITVNPLFNRKEYLGKNTDPMPVERYLVEITQPEVQIAYKNQIYNK